MKTRLLYTVIFFLIFKMTTAQTTVPNVIPPDPISAEFQKYLGYPVSYATGLPQINVPLYTMNAAGVSIPFSLSYHASGIKVGQNMGIVGLGWSLFPGCKITRTIMGKPDDEYPTNDIRDMDTTRWSDYDVQRFTSGGKAIDFSGEFDYLYNIVPHSVLDSDMWSNGLQSGSTGFKDTQHDLFTLHLPNTNVTFILEWVAGELKATTIPESSIKIDVKGLNSHGQFYSFEVTDADGVLYEFASSWGNCDINVANDDAMASWFLEKMDPPGVNNTITFNYNNLAYIDNEEWVYETLSLTDEIYIGNAYEQSPSPAEYNTVHAEQFSSKTLSNISYETGESITFEYLQPAIYKYADVLNKITFKNRNNKIIKTVDLLQENKQLKKLTVSGEGGYEFVYDEQEITKAGSNYVGRDFLGLFNGTFSSVSAIPEMYLYYYHHFLGGNSFQSTNKLGDINPTFHPIKSQARILKNIIYPTGGQTSFEYEPNFYKTGSSETVVSGLGLRIKEIDTYDPVSNKTLTKSYEYSIGNCASPYINYQGPSSSYEGHYTNPYISQQFNIFTGSSNRTRTINPTAKTGVTVGPIIWYNQVTEYSNGGKTVYNYEFIDSEYIEYKDGGFPADDIVGIPLSPLVNTKTFFPRYFRNVGNSSPRLTSKEVKDGNNTTLQLMEYNYSKDKRNILQVYARNNNFTNQSLLNTLPVSGVVTLSVSEIKSYFGEGFDYQNDSRFKYFTNGLWYYLPSGVAYIGAYKDFLKGDNFWLEISNDKLISTKQTDYRDGKEIVNETTLVYDKTYKFNLKQKTTSTSDGGTITEKYYYPVGDAIPDLLSLSNEQKSMVTTLARTKNYQGRVIEKEVYKNNTLLNKELYGYKDWGNTIYKTENVYSKKGNASSFETLFTIDSYDNKGNVTDVLKRNGTHAAYIWGYGKQYPVAKLENVTTSQKAAIQSLINNVENNSDSDVSEVSNNKTTENNLKASLDIIRNNGTLSNAMISTYTYDPLVGITSTTDPKGNTTYYNYNSDFKLESINDNNGNRLQEYKYNYIPYGTYEAIPVPVYSGSLTDGGGQTLIDQVTGGGTGSISGVTYTVSPTAFNFGSNIVGSTTTKTFTITNTTPALNTTDFLVISSIHIPNGFALNTALPIYVSRSTPVDIEIEFIPTTSNTYSGSAGFSSNGVGPSSIQLSGIGTSGTTQTKIISITDNSGNPINSALDFGEVSDDEGTTSLRTIRIYNTGNTALMLNDITFGSTYPFTTYNSVMLPQTIQPGSYMNYEIEFIPYSSTGTYTTTLTFGTNKTGGIDSIQLTGDIIY
jgi:YD repeat-containing protein